MIFYIVFSLFIVFYFFFIYKQIYKLKPIRFVSNVYYISKMESTREEKLYNTTNIESQQSQQPENYVNTQPNENLEDEMQNDLNELKNLIHGLRNTRGPFWLSLATSLDQHIESIDHSYG